MDSQRKTIKVAAYLRVSTDEQAKEGYGIDTQLRHIQNLVDAHKEQGWVLEKENIYKDEGYSGTLRERPALNKIMNDAKFKKIDVVMVWKIDRFFRNMRLLLEAIDKLGEYDVGFKSVTEPFDTTAVGKFIFQIFGALAEFERNLILTRTTEGKISSAKEGRYQGGGYPYGYKLDENRHLVVVPEEAKWVRTIFRWFVEDNVTIVTIAERLKKLKIARKRDSTRIKKRVHTVGFWHPGTITKLLRRTHYVGHYYYNREGKDKNGAAYIKPEKDWIRFSCPPIIDRATFFKAEKKLDENRLSNNAKTIYLLSSKIQCGECGSMFTGYTSIKRTKNYRCGKTNRTKTSVVCKAKNISENIIAGTVWKMVKAILKDPRAVLDKLEADYKREHYYNHLLDEKEQLEKRRLANQTARSNIRELVRFGSYSAQEAQGEIQIVDRELGEIMESIEGVDAQLKAEEGKGEKIHSIKELAKRYKKDLDDLTYDEKYVVLQAVVKRVVLKGNDVQLSLQVPKLVQGRLNKSNDVYGVPGKNRTCI